MFDAAAYGLPSVSAASAILPIRSTPTSAPMTATVVVRMARPSSVQPSTVLALAQISRTIAQSISVYANDGNYEALDDAGLGHDIRW